MFEPGYGRGGAGSCLDRCRGPHKGQSSRFRGWMAFGAQGPRNGNAGRTFVASVQIWLWPYSAVAVKTSFAADTCSTGLRRFKRPKRAVLVLVARWSRARVSPDARCQTRLRVSTPATVRVAVHALFFFNRKLVVVG